MTNPKLSLIVTALNEEKNILPFLSHLKMFLNSLDLTYEVLFVDDGSADGTLSELRQFKDWSELRVLQNGVNMGTGASVKKALKFARGVWYTWLPSDLEVMPEELREATGLLEQNDIIVTFFKTGQGSRTVCRRILSYFFTKIINFSFGYRLPYYNGVSFIRRSLLRADLVKARGFFFHAELLLRTLGPDLRISATPINLTPRKYERPKALSLKVFKDVVSCFFKTLWEVRIRA
jgi:glycosyltransferase involved in cell wall biosynthesis